MCPKEVVEVHVPPVGEVFPYERPEATPGGALVLLGVIFIRETLVDELGDGVIVPVAALELVGEVEVFLRQGRLDLEPVAQSVAVPGFDEASDTGEKFDRQGHCFDGVGPSKQTGSRHRHTGIHTHSLTHTLTHTLSFSSSLSLSLSLFSLSLSISLVRSLGSDWHQSIMAVSS